MRDNLIRQVQRDRAEFVKLAQSLAEQTAQIRQVITRIDQCLAQVTQ